MRSDGKSCPTSPTRTRNSRRTAEDKALLDLAETAVPDGASVRGAARRAGAAGRDPQEGVHGRQTRIPTICARRAQLKIDISPAVRRRDRQDSSLVSRRTPPAVVARYKRDPCIRSSEERPLRWTAPTSQSLPPYGNGTLPARHPFPAIIANKQWLDGAYPGGRV